MRSSGGCDNRPMLLAVDVGNTQTHVGAFDGDRADRRLAPRHPRRLDRRRAGARHRRVAEFRDLERAGVEALIVSTVVPRLGPEYERLCASHLAAPCLLVGPAAKTGMAILNENPREVGADRIVNAVAAYERVGGRCIVGRLRDRDQRSTRSPPRASTWAASSPRASRSRSRRSPRGRPSCRGSSSPSPSGDRPQHADERCSRASSTASRAWSTASCGGCVDELGDGAAGDRDRRHGDAIAPLCDTIDEVDPT